MQKIKLLTKNITPWVNTKEFIILHHTGDYPIKSIISTLTTWKVSCHYIVDRDWKLYQVWNEEDILWHAGISSWKWRNDMNKYSIGIEVVWPIFTDAQKVSVKELVREIAQRNSIKEENILRHKDISPWRKVDIDDSFWNKDFKTYKDFISSIFGNMGEYEKLFKSKYSESSIYWDIEGLIVKTWWNRELIFALLIGFERIIQKKWA